jgi:translation initiation factor IF-1
MARGGQHRARELERRGEPEPSAGECSGVVVSVGRGDLHFVDVAIGTVTRRVLCHRSGKMNLHRIACVAGDRVTCTIDPYDPSKGRIVRRWDGTP